MELVKVNHHSEAIADKKLFYTKLHENVSRFMGNILKNYLDIGKEFMLARSCFGTGDASELYEWAQNSFGIERRQFNEMVRCARFVDQNKWIEDHTDKLNRTLILQMSSSSVEFEHLKVIRQRLEAHVMEDSDKKKPIILNDIKRMINHKDILIQDAYEAGDENAAKELRKPVSKISVEGMRKNLVKITNSLRHKKLRKKDKAQLATIRALALELQNICDDKMA